MAIVRLLGCFFSLCHTQSTKQQNSNAGTLFTKIYLKKPILKYLFLKKEVLVRTFTKAGVSSLMVILLSGCGGGGACGDKSQAFGVSFARSTYTLVKGTPATIGTTVTPESCRSSMTFSSGGLFSETPPPGMGIVNGNLAGTPTTVGSYTYRIRIDGVDGYEPFYSSKPYSGQITIVVTP